MIVPIDAMIAASTAKVRQATLDTGNTELIRRFDRVAELGESLINSMHNDEQDGVFLEVLHRLDKQESSDLIMYLVNEVAMRRKGEEAHGVR